MASLRQRRSAEHRRSRRRRTMGFPRPRRTVTGKNQGRASRRTRICAVAGAADAAGTPCQPQRRCQLCAAHLRAGAGGKNRPDRQDRARRRHAQAVRSGRIRANAHGRSKQIVIT